MTWFEELTGVHERFPGAVRENLVVDGDRLRSLRNGQSWQHGRLETPTLAVLRARASNIGERSRISIREVIANVQDLHRNEANAGAMFQVASQFNLLEMTSPDVTPEYGVGIYENDFTQGPACAIAAGAGAIYRNYFAEVNGKIGQSADNQIDCLAGVGVLLGNTQGKLWEMVNGYALPSETGLQDINRQLSAMNEASRDEIRQALQIGLQWDTQVTLAGASHTVSQAYCSGTPVAYTSHASELWKPLATLVLEAAYEATVCAATVNSQRTGNKRLFLTLLGGGAFGNELDWILGAMSRALGIHSDAGLDVAIVSHRRSQPGVQQLIRENAGLRNTKGA